MERPLIFITNDDSVGANGLQTMIDVARQVGRVIVVAPESTQSGMSHAITMTSPLYLRHVRQEQDLEIYACAGTPVDCVKLAFDYLLKEEPALILSGVNHGSNSAVSVLYSGTMAAAIEGSSYNIPSLGFSVTDHDPEADFTQYIPFIRQIIDHVLNATIELPFCLNINIPNVSAENIAGIRACRQTRGFWREEFEKRSDPRGRDYFWLTGSFQNMEPDAQDTDEWALAHNYIAIVPIQVDLTSYRQLEHIEKWKF